MQIDVVPVAVQEAGVLAQLYELYLYDFAERDGTGRQVADDRRFGEADVERFLSMPERSAFLIRVDQKLAGFCMLKRGSRLAGDMGAMDVAEFFVLRNHRRQGVGQAAATLLWQQYPGPALFFPAPQAPTPMALCRSRPHSAGRQPRGIRSPAYGVDILLGRAIIAPSTGIPSYRAAADGLSAEECRCA
jgi:predicted acetyltransferase